jgi:hypothetical protein
MATLFFIALSLGELLTARANNALGERGEGLSKAAFFFGLAAFFLGGLATGRETLPCASSSLEKT